MVKPFTWAYRLLRKAVCNERLAQSTFRPCIICSGEAVAPGHALVLEGGETVITFDAEAVAASVPLAADGTCSQRLTARRSPPLM